MPGQQFVCARPVIPVYSYAWLRLVFFGRIFPGLIFGFFAWRQLLMVQASFTSIRPGHVVSDFFVHVAPTLFYLPYSVMCMLIYLTRPAPHGRDSSLVAWILAFGGTVLIAVVGAVAPPGPQLYGLPPWVSYAVTPLLLGAIVLAVASVSYLRHSLSIIPEARKLVRTGPYRFVRHPLYLAEMLGVGVAIIAGGRVVFLLALAVEVGLQYSRARLEERILRRTLPEYAAYARHTKAIIPGVL